MSTSGEKEYRYGLAFLRIVACLQIVFIHYGEFGEDGVLENVVFHFGGGAVPTFFILAMMMTDPLDLAKDGAKLKNRLIRLYLPMLFWGGTYWLLYRVINLLFNAGLRDSFSVLFFQLIFGSDINPVFWFNFDLIIITLLMVIIYRIFPNKTADRILVLIAIACVILQYCGVGDAIFKNVRYEIQRPCHNLFGMTPFACIGVFIGRLFEKGSTGSTLFGFFRNPFVNLKRMTIYIATVAFWIILMYGRGHIWKASEYLPLIRLVKASLSVLIVGAFPMWDRLRDSVKRIIKELSDRTMAVYAMHIAVGKIVCAGVDRLGIRTSSVALCVFIFVICAGIGELMILVFGKKCRYIA